MVRGWFIQSPSNVFIHFRNTSYGLLCCALDSIGFLTWRHELTVSVKFLKSSELMAGMQLHLWAQWRLKQASAQLPGLWVLQTQCLTVDGWVTRSAFLSAAHVHIMSASLAVCTPVFLNAYRTSWARPAIPDVTLLWYRGMSLCTSSVSTWSWLSIRENACWVCGRKPYLAGSSAVWRNEDANGLYLREPSGSVGVVMLLGWRRRAVANEAPYLVLKEAAEQYFGN